MPKYLQIKNSLLEKLNNGEFQPGDKFYSESELKKEFNVSSITVIKAITELVNDGYLVRYQGKGTFVSKARRGKIVKFTEKENIQHDEEDVKVIEVELMKDPRIAKELRIAEEEPFYSVKRIRYSDGCAFILQNTFILPEFIGHEEIKSLENFKSIYEMIKNKFGISLFQAEFTETTEIIFPAPLEICTEIDLKDAAPVVFTKRHTYIADGRVVEYIESYKRWDYFNIRIDSV
ncbi:GntR family transcriptional regulator [Bacillales bacterium AN1005]|uniref:GntR family transcriptional regulator n=1 Tax=Niallia taxi TaxID=2499688 RepID=UPI0021A2ABBC|nr:GntR family transcriptional regulator [Niallia taxi]MCT2346825.1 GntR family transcriptional regulator [Niallia taxi]